MADVWKDGKKVEEVTFSGGTFDSSGRTLTPSGAGGSVATDSIWDAKGDLSAATGVDAAVRVAAGANDYVLTADSAQAAGVKWALPPGDEIGYDQITSNVSVTATTEASGTTIITCSAYTFDGAAVILEFFSPAVNIGTVSGNFVVINLFEGSTQIGRLAELSISGANATRDEPVFCRYRFAPSAGSHTYTITAWKGGTASVGAGSGGTAGRLPAFVRFTKV